MAEKFSTTDPTRMEPEAMSDWVDLFKLNTIAPFFIIRAFTKLLVKGAEVRGPGATSSVINISSAAATMKFGVSGNAVSYPMPRRSMTNSNNVAVLRGKQGGAGSTYCYTRSPLRVDECPHPGE